MIDTPDRFGTELRQLAATAALSPTGGDLLRPEPHHTYELLEKPERIYAIDANGAEICGARRPFGHDHYLVYVHTRVTGDLHQVIALTREAAVSHVRMIAELYTGKAA